MHVVNSPSSPSAPLPGLEALVLTRKRVVGQADYPAGSTFGPRVLSDFELVWIVDGDVTWHADGTDHALSAGSVTLCLPGMRDAFTWDKKRRTRHGYVHFDLEDPKGVLPPRSEWPRVRHFPGDNVLVPLLRHVLWLTQNNQPESLVLSALRHAIAIFVLGATGAESHAQAGEHPIVTAALRLVHLRWRSGRAEDISLAELARAAKKSRGHVVRVFREELGVTPHEALALLRMSRAQTLLSRTNLAVGEVAEQCGFDNPFHFSRRFHELSGFSPREFRKRVAGGFMPPDLPEGIRPWALRIWSPFYA
jgi:AraC family transcriptional regulator